MVGGGMALAPRILMEGRTETVVARDRWRGFRKEEPFVALYNYQSFKVTRLWKILTDHLMLACMGYYDFC